MWRGGRQCEGPALTGMTAGAITIVTQSPLKLAILNRSVGPSWSNSLKAMPNTRDLGAENFGAHEELSRWRHQRCEPVASLSLEGQQMLRKGHYWVFTMKGCYLLL